MKVHECVFNYLCNVLPSPYGVGRGVYLGSASNGALFGAAGGGVAYTKSERDTKHWPLICCTHMAHSHTGYVIMQGWKHWSQAWK